MVNKKRKKFLNGPSIIGLMLLLLLVLLIGVGILYFSNTSYMIPFALMVYLGLGVFLSSRFIVQRRMRIMAYYVTIGGLLAAILYAIPGIYHDTRPVVQPTQVDLREYSPFREDTKAVPLDEPSTLTLEEPLPKIDGATAFYPVYASFAQAVYPEKEYHPYDSEVESNRTGFAYEYLMEGLADMIFVLGPSEEQLNRAKEQGVTLHLTPIAKEAFVFFTHKNNPVTDLSTKEIRAIYSGEVTNWKEVGGKNQSIRAFQREANSGSQTALERFMEGYSIMDPPTEDIATLMGTMVDVVSDYRNYPNALGYTFRYYSTEMVENNDIRLLNINGVPPTVETIRSGEYPIIDDIYVVTTDDQNPKINEFIEWILSDQGQSLIEKTGYVPIKSFD